VGAPWWTLTESEAEARRRRALVEQAAGLLRQVLLPDVDPECVQGSNEERTESAAKGCERLVMGGGEEMSAWVSVEGLGWMLGMLEMNQVAMVLKSPLAVYAEHLASLPAEKGSVQDECLRRLGPLAWKLQCILDDQEAVSSSDDEDADQDADINADLDASSQGSEEEVMRRRLYSSSPTAGEIAGCATFLFPPFDGIALFNIVCTMNHSCVPNVEISYPSDGRSPAVAHVVALTDIRAGSELVHSYIQEEAGFLERSKQLLSYDFACDCEKCSNHR